MKSCQTLNAITEYQAHVMILNILLEKEKCMSNKNKKYKSKTCYKCLYKQYENLHGLRSNQQQNKTWIYL